MFCRKCNTENEQRALFCIECGESLAEPEPEEPVSTVLSGQVFGFIGLLSLGILLLGTSFIYQRNKDKLQAWIKE
jgi:hypothetical protein